MSLKRRFLLPMVLMLLFSSVALAGCDAITGTSPQGEGFAIYLTADNLSIKDIPDLDKVELCDTPFISQDDIIRYVWNTQEITLTVKAARNVGGYRPPTFGEAFIVSVDGEPVYAGTLLSSFSSYLPSGIVCYSYPILLDGEQAIPIRLMHGPNGSDDLLRDERVKQALEAAGKLVRSKQEMITGASSDGEGFAIYLTGDTTPHIDIPELDQLKLAGGPLITEEDIISYDWETHEITLTPESFQIFSIENPEVAVGNVFAVCIDRQPLYGGVFFSSYISRSYDGIVIVIDDVHIEKENTIRIGSGYPWDIGQDDARGDTRIRQALASAGKLK